MSVSEKFATGEPFTKFVIADEDVLRPVLPTRCHRCKGRRYVQMSKTSGSWPCSECKGTGLAAKEAKP